MNDNCIEIINLTYSNIFKNFSLKFPDKKFITISGPNNCGKTTLIRIIENQSQIKNSILIYGKKQEDYKITELSNIIKTVIPLEFNFIENTIEEELSYQLPIELPKQIRQQRIKEVAKKYKLTKFLTTPVEILTDEVIIKLQLALAVINKPKVILIDDLNPYFSKKDLIEIIKTIKEFNKEENITIIMATNNLELSLLCDYIYIINDSKIVIEGQPIDVLEKDNILNKTGLNLPFMIDLSVKLRDYDLIKTIELDCDRMVDTLWK